jgi:hypothetical protein
MTEPCCRVRRARRPGNVRAHAHCPECRVSLRAAVFVRRRATRIGPFRFGHVAWAFQIQPDERGDAAPLAGVWSAGAVENGAAHAVCGPERAGYWSATTADLPALMRAHRYDEYKTVRVEDACPHAALRVQAAIARRPYAILVLNCVTRTKQVLRAFGAALPSTRRRVIPNDWYDSIDAPSFRL